MRLCQSLIKFDLETQLSKIHSKLTYQASLDHNKLTINLILGLSTLRDLVLY